MLAKFNKMEFNFSRKKTYHSFFEHMNSNYKLMVCSCFIVYTKNNITGTYSTLKNSAKIVTQNLSLNVK